MNWKNLLGVGRRELLSSGVETTGKIESVKLQRWLKVKDSPINIGDSAATYPAIITVCYEVDGQTYRAQLWCSARRYHPAEGLHIPVWYDPAHPEHCAAKF